MLKRGFAVFFTQVVVLTFAPQSALAQVGGEMPMRTPDGQPDVSGIFTFRTLTPLERPTQFSGQESLTAEEAATFEASERTRQNRDLFDPETGAPNAGYQPRADGGVLSYNEFWYERGVELTADKRTSLIVDPPDGRVPELTTAGAERVAERVRINQRPTEGPEDRPLGERCITGFNSGPPMLPAAYNMNVQIFQTLDHVVLLNEMVHNARIIPLDGSDHGTVPMWTGVSRGHWEGDTLVVETKNFLRETSFRSSSDNLHLIERIQRQDEDTLVYTFTVTDPTTWTAPWTVELPMRRSDLTMFEYACHEGNYGMEGTLSGARVIEKSGE